MYSALPVLIQVLPYAPQASVISSFGGHDDLDQRIRDGGDEHWHVGTLSKQHKRCLWQQVGDTYNIQGGLVTACYVSRSVLLDTLLSRCMCTYLLWFGYGSHVRSWTETLPAVSAQGNELESMRTSTHHGQIPGPPSSPCYLTECPVGHTSTSALDRPGQP